jgi:uncharacterized membrane protein
MEIFYAMNFLMGLFGLIVLGLTYTYIDKMEKVGCACSEHKYRHFIKVWSLIALIIVGVMMFAPLKLVESFSTELGMAYSVVYVLFLIVHVVYLIMSLMYIDHLVKEKCKCSEDLRRELLYFWFILRALIILGLVILPLFVKLGMTSVGMISDADADIIGATANPVPGLRKVPRSLKNTFKMK